MCKNASWMWMVVFGLFALQSGSCTKDENILAADMRPVLDSVINGGGATFPNMVFIDLSDKRQSPVVRSSWDLGFAMGAGFEVILNYSVNMLARPINKTNINEVTAADTVGLTGAMLIGPNATAASLPFIDHPTGEVARAAIGTVRANAADNRVFIVNRGTDAAGNARKWQKIRVLRNGSGGYTVQYADINATTHSSVEVAKDAKFNYRFVSLDAGRVVEVEPEADKWDIVWTYFINTISMGPAGEVPYGFQDFVLINNKKVQAVQVLANTGVTYDNVKPADVASLTFSADRRVIGSNWRSGGGPNAAPAVRTDRFYLLRDAGGKVYKIQFTALTRSGERGFPQVRFAEVR